MKIDARIPYRQAKRIMATGIFVKGLKEAIDEWEALSNFLKNTADTLEPLGDALAVCPDAELKSAMEDAQKAIEALLARGDIRNYFLEKDDNGETPYLLLFEDIIGAAARAKYIVEGKVDQEDPHNLKTNYREFVGETIKNFCHEVRKDFEAEA